MSTETAVVLCFAVVGMTITSCVIGAFVIENAEMLARVWRSFRREKDE